MAYHPDIKQFITSIVWNQT